MRSIVSFVCLQMIIVALLMPACAGIRWKCADRFGQLEIMGIACDGDEDKRGNIVLNIPRFVDGVEVAKIADGAFRGNQEITSVFVPSNVNCIGSEAFLACSNLTTLVLEPSDIGSSLSILSMAFANCVRLKNIDVKTRCISVSSYAFANCTSIEEAVLSECCEMCESSFCGCKKLARVDMAMYSDELLSAFWGCDALKTISISDENPMYRVVDGALVYKNHAWLLRYPSGWAEEKVDLHFHPELIFPYAFESCQAKEIVLREGLRAIGKAAFSRCVNIREISIPSSVEAIDDYAFAGCYNLVTVAFKGDRLPEVGENVFPANVKFKGDRLSPEHFIALERSKMHVHQNSSLDGSGSAKVQEAKR